MNIQQYDKYHYHFIKITQQNFEVVLCDLGASIFSIRLDGRYMTETPVDEKDFLTKGGFNGRTIGRVGNRIKGNQITIDGKTYEIMNNEGPNTLHGGVDGLSTKRFTYEINETADKVDVVFRYLSKDGESGFPGNIDFVITYTVEEGKNEVLITFDCASDMKTPCSVTNHAYYTVGEPSLEHTKLYINASHYLHCQSEDLLPIEKRATPDYLSFKKARNIMEDINHPDLMCGKAKGYDHHFYFDDLNPNSLKSELIGREYKMSIYSDFNGMQIYSYNYLTNIECHELVNDLRRCLAMEPQDSFLNLNLLSPNEQYHRFIRLVFTKI